MKRIFTFFGGRKNYQVHVALLAGSAAAYPLEATFYEYAAFLCLVLGIGAFSIAYEDRGKPSIGGDAH